MTRKAARHDLKNQIILIPEHHPSVNIVDIANELGTSLIPWEGCLVQKLIPRRNAAPNARAPYGKSAGNRDCRSADLPTKQPVNEQG